MSWEPVDEPDADDVRWGRPGMAAGVFRRLVHHVRDDARTIQRDGLTFCVAHCGAIAVPTYRPQSGWTWCVQCWTGHGPAVVFHGGDR